MPSHHLLWVYCAEQWCSSRSPLPVWRHWGWWVNSPNRLAPRTSHTKLHHILLSHILHHLEPHRPTAERFVTVIFLFSFFFFNKTTVLLFIHLLVEIGNAQSFHFPFQLIHFSYATLCKFQCGILSCLPGGFLGLFSRFHFLHAVSEFVIELFDLIQNVWRNDTQ